MMDSIYKTAPYIFQYTSGDYRYIGPFFTTAEAKAWESDGVKAHSEQTCFIQDLDPRLPDFYPSLQLQNEPNKLLYTHRNVVANHLSGLSTWRQPGVVKAADAIGSALLQMILPRRIDFYIMRWHATEIVFTGPFDAVEAARVFGKTWERTSNGDRRWRLMTVFGEELAKPIPVISPADAYTCPLHGVRLPTVSND